MFLVNLRPLFGTPIAIIATYTLLVTEPLARLTFLTAQFYVCRLPIQPLFFRVTRADRVGWV